LSSQFVNSEEQSISILDPFILPVGSALAGEQAFIDLQCVACHIVDGKNLPAADEMLDISVTLSSTTFIKSPAVLVTAIINPSHSVKEDLPSNTVFAEDNARMPDFNDVMTVTQLIDLVAFLKQKGQ
jgi:hypothetical protein